MFKSIREKYVSAYPFLDDITDMGDFARSALKLKVPKDVFKFEVWFLSLASVHY